MIQFLLAAPRSGSGKTTMTCARSFYVGDVKKEDIHAKFEDGILHIELPDRKSVV